MMVDMEMKLRAKKTTVVCTGTLDFCATVE